MQALEALIAGAKAEVEVQRQLQICNACRYCEGFCAVFPAMTRRLEFPFSDIHYLANLCHGCGACLHACQYAPPHQFAVNLPRAMARVRARTYAEFAWPAPLARLYERNGLVLALALVATLALFLVLALLRQGAGEGTGLGDGPSAGASAGMRALWGAVAEGRFYAIFPHGLMVGLFAPVFLFAVLALGIGVVRFWRGVAGGEPHAAAISEAAHDALRLKYLDGGHGQGCPNEDDRFTLARRRFHHFTMYGFLLCFAATVVATLYHYGLGQPAPYAWTSGPKVLGTLGGAGLVIGTLGLWWLRQRRDPDLMEPTQRAMDEGFIALLFLTGASGLALALARTTPAMPLLLCLHLASVLAFFATMPYGKFTHGVYRGAALLKWAVERRLPSRLRLGSE